MKTPRNTSPVSWELVFWSTIAVLLATWSTVVIRRDPGSAVGLRADHASDDTYSWVGDDFPAYYPLEVGDVIMYPEDTAHYPINGEDAEEQWESQFPKHGKGWVCLGPERRPFALTMYHELHCLGRLRKALEDGADRESESQNEHVQHCLNYLRMMTLCRADVALEPVIDTQGSVELTQPHLCRDWGKVYEEASKNMEQCKKHGTIWRKPT